MRTVILVQIPTIIWTKWTNHISQLLIVPRVNDVRQTEIHTAEPLEKTGCILSHILCQMLC